MKPTNSPDAEHAEPSEALVDGELNHQNQALSCRLSAAELNKLLTNIRQLDEHGFVSAAHSAAVKD